tara:strand:+ start:186 stop:1469 length:1284 start_codon:yes stop_codon:yes gene_type:complete
MAQSIFDKNSLLNKYSLLGQGSPNQQFLQQQKINQGIPPLMNPEPAQTSPTMGTVPANNTRNVKFSNTSPSRGNNLLQGVSDFTGTTFGQGFTQGLLGAGRYSPVPITFGQALSEAMSAGNELVTERGKQKSYRPMTAEEKIAYGITSGNFAIDTTSGLPVNLDDGSTNVNINEAGENELQKLSAKSLNKVDEGLTKKSETAFTQNTDFTKIRNILRLVPEGDTGAFADEKLRIKRLLGYDVAGLEALNIEFGKFVMGQIQNTKGAVSEREMDYFGNISPTITKTRKGLELMIDIMEMSNDKVIEKGEFYNSWIADYIAKNPKKSTTETLSAWRLAEKDWEKENNSILDKKVQNRITDTIIDNYEGTFDRSGFDSVETQNQIKNFEKQNGFDEGQSLIMEVIGDQQVLMGFFQDGELVRTNGVNFAE